MLFMSAVHPLAGVDLNRLVVLDAASARSQHHEGGAAPRTHAVRCEPRARSPALDVPRPLVPARQSDAPPDQQRRGARGPLRELLATTQALVSRSGTAFDASKLERSFVVAGTDHAKIVLLPQLMPRLRREAPGRERVLEAARSGS
jgi:hypothetical protein